MKKAANRIRAGLILGFLVVLAVPAAAQAPEGFTPPPLHPAGTQLRTQELAPGVYALLSSRPPVDNSGFVVGQRGILVIDAHINAAMAGQIQAAVRQVTSKPILYLVNTNYHGDHTFGNYAFPAETLVVAHRLTAERMRDFEQEKRFLLGTVNNDRTVYADARLRLPEVVFEDYLRLDLGGQVVELYHFGRGNTPGDTVVYVPGARVAWTGNLVVGDLAAGQGSIPFLIEGRPGAYLQTLARFAETLEVETLVPGHGVPGPAAVLGRYMAYLHQLIESVRQARRNGQTLEETLARTPLGEQYAPPADTPAPMVQFLAGLHRWNVQRVYQELNGR